MPNKNILNQFKATLGQYCSINQFIELSKRGFLSEHGDVISDREKFIDYANRNQITLTEYNADKMDKFISLSYIVNIHLCFESFLHDLLIHMRKYGATVISEKNKEDSLLIYVVKNLIIDSSYKLQPLIDICEYYRLVRNKAVHSSSEDNAHKIALSKLNKHSFVKDAKFCKLSAPNCFDYISFDDFVMFARSVNELAISLYCSFQYDYDMLISEVLLECKPIINKYQNKPERIKSFLYSHIITYFKGCDDLLEKIEKCLKNQG